MKKAKKEKASTHLPQGYVTFEQLKRRLLKNKEVRKAFEATRFEHEVMRAIIRRRIETGFSQKEIARRAGMQQSAVARFEAGNTSPTLETVSRIASALKIKVHIS
jgi:ribosome-binding protein aMBF1 (putative translation factor)